MKLEVPPGLPYIPDAKKIEKNFIQNIVGTDCYCLKS